MKDSEDLFELAKSMTKTEKAYFKKYGHKQSNRKVKDSIYVKMFEILDSQREYDAERLVKKMKKIHPGFKLPTAKNYLFNLLLKTLSEFHGATDPKAQLQHNIREIKILLNKGLKKQARKLMYKAEQLASKYDDQYALLEIYRFKERVIDIGKSEYENKEAAYLQRKEIINNLNIANELNWLAKKVYMHIYGASGGQLRTTEEREKMMEFINHPLLKNESARPTFQARYHYHNIFSYYHIGLRNLTDSLRHLKKLVNLFEDNPEMKKILPLSYINVMFNTLVVMNNLRDFQEFDDYIESFKAFINTPELKSFSYLKTNFNLYITQLEKHLYACEFERGLELIPEIEQKIELFANMNKRKLMVLYYFIAATYFFNGKFDESLDWFNEMINDDNARYSHEKLYFAGRILIIIVHFELGNHFLLEHLIKSTYRELLKVEKPMKTEAILIKFLKKLTHIPDRASLLQSFKQLRQELIGSGKSDVNNIESGFFDFIAWLDSKIDRKPLAQVMREKIMRNESAPVS